MNNTWKQKHQQVRRIEDLAYHLRAAPGKGPREVKALMWCCAVFLAGILIRTVLPKIGVSLPVLPWPLLEPFLLLALTLGIYVAIRVFSKASTSYHDLLYTSLAEYAPVDKESFRQFQARTRAEGHLDDRELLIWAMGERRAIALAAGWLKAEAAFLDRTL